MVDQNEINKICKEIYEFNNDLNNGFMILNKLVKNLNWILMNNIDDVNIEKIFKNFGEIIECNIVCYLEKIVRHNKIFYKNKFEWINDKKFKNYLKIIDPKFRSIIDSIENSNCFFKKISDLPLDLQKELNLNKVKSILFLPVLDEDNNTLGLICFCDCEKEREFGFLEIQSLKSVSIILSTIFKIKLEKELRANEINNAIIDLRSIREKFDETNNKIRKIL